MTVNASSELQAPSKFKLYTYEDLTTLDPPEWLIEGAIETATLAVLYGPSGTGKSFLALDWALAVARGQIWNEKKTKQGLVVYVVGEGTAGIVRRIEAWKQHNQVGHLTDAFFLLDAPQLHTAGDLDRLSTTLKDQPKKPALIVLDTLARCFVGGDENTAKDMGAFVGACHRLKAETAAALLIIHHAGKQRTQNKRAAERGSSALRAAADVMIELRKTADGVIEAVNDKQKEDEEFKPMAFRLKQVPLGEKNGKALSSCVLVPASAADIQALKSSPTPGLSESESFALKVLVEMGPATSGKWHAAIVEEKAKGIPTKTFQNWRTALVTEGFVELVPDEDHTYRATPKGKEVANGTLSKVA